MSRLAEKLARLQAEADDRERVILVEPPIVFGTGEYRGAPQVIGGTAESRRAAVEAWYAAHPEAPRPSTTDPKKPHQSADVGVGRGRTRKPAVRTTRASRPS